MVRRAALRGVFGQLDHIIDHHAVLLTDGRGFVIAFQSFDQFFVQRDATQKLCVGFDSIHAPVGN